jgi:hypothetical protein
MKFEIADTINKLVSRKYQSGKSSGSLIFSQTELTVIYSKSGIPVTTSPIITLKYPSGADAWSSFSFGTAQHFRRSLELSNSIPEDPIPYRSPTLSRIRQLGCWLLGCLMNGILRTI